MHWPGQAVGRGRQGDLGKLSGLGSFRLYLVGIHAAEDFSIDCYPDVLDINL